MSKINIINNYQDPEDQQIEIVERKGLGHPDTLADILANEISAEYSKYCLDNFGCILHHNFDKLYIGAGYYKNDFGSVEKISPINIQINGRVSNKFAHHIIDLKKIEDLAIQNSILKILPNIKMSDLNIISNATQNTKNKNWYSPETLLDIPDADDPKANDTSFCTSSYPLSDTEQITLDVEKYFWKNVDGFPSPKFDNVGQDIKVMSIRNKNDIDVTLCVPVLSEKIMDIEEYNKVILDHENKLNDLFSDKYKNKNILIKINPHQKIYMLGKGSCLECGEEGMVGRGNSITGVISSYRTHTLESWAGKNPVYHTGRVFGFLTYFLAKKIYEKFNTKCSVSILTKCGDSLIPPFFTEISTEKEINELLIRDFVEEFFINTDYIKEILNFKPWNI